MNHNATAPETAEGRVAPRGRELSAGDEERLREALRRCSPATQEAALAFRKTGSAELVPAIVFGLIERYTDREARSKLAGTGDGVRLIEDLALDSLTMLEIVFLAEEVLQISVDNEEFRPFRTVGDVKAFIASKLAASPA
jgi:3-hydroxyacyl-[acyl-carrier-protein] dehydratase